MEFIGGYCMNHFTPGMAFSEILRMDRPDAVAWISGNEENPKLSGKVSFYRTPYEGILVEAEIFGALKGNTALMLSNTGNAPAKLIKEFTKGDKTGEAKPQLKAAYVEETVYVGKQNLEFLCAIKSKNELIAELVALLQSPAKNVVSALQSGQNTIHGVLQTLGERAE